MTSVSYKPVSYLKNVIVLIKVSYQNKMNYEKVTNIKINESYLYMYDVCFFFMNPLLHYKFYIVYMNTDRFQTIDLLFKEDFEGKWPEFHQ